MEKPHRWGNDPAAEHTRCRRCGATFTEAGGKACKTPEPVRIHPNYTPPPAPPARRVMPFRVWVAVVVAVVVALLALIGVGAALLAP